MVEQDMMHLCQPRGKGYALRRKTPEVLVGTINPWTKKPFGKEIKLGLDTSVHAEAIRLRDIRLGQIAQLEADAKAAIGKKAVGRIIDLTPEAAEEWREARRKEKEAVDALLPDQLDRADRAGFSDEVRQFAKIVYGGDMLLEKALERYLEDRAEGNSNGFKPLSLSTQKGLTSAVNAVIEAKQGEEATLHGINKRWVHWYRTEYLAKERGLSAKSIEGHTSHMRGLWRWAIVDKKRLRTRSGKPIDNPWEIEQGGTAKVSTHKTKKARDMFEPEHVEALLSGFKAWGSRQGDLMRLTLVTGARVDEIASMPLADVEADGSGMKVGDGKTDNAIRFIPLVGDAQRLLQQRYEMVVEKQRREGTPKDQWRLFPEWPIRTATQKAAAASQWFTRYRREALGAETDGKLAMHSFRHTWRTVAGRTRIPEAHAKQLGGWAKGGEASEIYNHGLLKEQLVDAQREVWDALREQGYLKAF